MNNDTKNYTCPMHPEVVSDKPGRCSKCGMALVEAGSLPQSLHGSVEESGLGRITFKSYLPLLVIFIVLFAAAFIATDKNQFTLNGFLLNFMTGFFLVFAGFKLMDLKGFAEGYATYDLLAARWFGYGYIYPLIELAFGLAMLAGYHPAGLLWTEVAIMAFSGGGVAIKLARHERFMCACLGTFLKVPLTYVTLIEDFGMAIMALLLILSGP